MTIKEFAKLCGCNPQTLRYYDRQDLLKPVNVDKWSGYRFYDEEQAIVFVKIKNLQRAGFTIEEIKELLRKSDVEIFYAFEEKIAEAELRIREIREIQKAYQVEVVNMQNKIELFQKLLKDSLEAYDPSEEFGIDHDMYVGMVGEVETFLRQIEENGDPSRFEFSDYSDEDEGTDELYLESCLHNPDFDLIFERHGWNAVKDFYQDIPEMNKEDGYLLLFKIDPGKAYKTAFAYTMLWMCLAKADYTIKIGCTVIDSRDGENHFWLVKYKDVICPK